MEIICFSCSTAVPNSSIFCSSCGSKLKCQSCNSILSKNAKFCSDCGHPTANFNSNTYEAALNTVKFRKNETETSYEISFTDSVGKDGIKELVAAIASNKIVTAASFDNTAYLELPHTPKINDAKTSNHNGETSNLDTSFSQEQIISKMQGTQNIESPFDELPHINDLESSTAFKCSESEWLAVYAFYDSEQGTKTFSQDSVKEKYLKKRKTKSRYNNFLREWNKLFSDTIQTVNENEFKFKTLGLENTLSIIKGERSNNKLTKAAKKKPTTSLTRKTSAKSVEVVEFDIFEGNDKLSLEDFLTQHQPSSTHENILLIAYYAHKINRTDSFVEGNVEYAFRALNIKERPNHLRQIINNIKNTKRWFKDHSNGGWTVERLGETFLDKLRNAKKDEK